MTTAVTALTVGPDDPRSLATILAGLPPGAVVTLRPGRYCLNVALDRAP